jgi:hypothetical protein
MTSTLADRPAHATGGPGPRRRAAWGVAGAVLLVLLAAALPAVLGVDVKAGTAPPLLADWRPRLGPGTLPAALLAALACTPVLHRAADRLAWPALLAAAWLVGVGWLLSLALVDGVAGVAGPLDQGREYLPTARSVGDVPAALRGFVDRIPFDHPDHWAVHVAGHPPGALLLFVGLARLGLGTGLEAGLWVVGVAATTPLAVAVALRAVGDERVARTALPFLVMGPAALWQGVSADAAFAAVAAWAAAGLALAVTARALHGRVGWAALSGLLLAACVFLSYGLVLLALLAGGVLLAARRWRPLPVVVPVGLAAGLGVVAVFAGLGFAWWEAFPVLRERYWAGIASQRPEAYWLWGNIAALVLCAGPAVAASVPAALSAYRQPRRPAGLGRLLPPADGGAVPVLVTSAVAMVVVADLSLMSKAEVERIWLPFVPWLVLAVAALPPGWRRGALAAQAGSALALQHLLWTPW